MASLRFASQVFAAEGNPHLSPAVIASFGGDLSNPGLADHSNAPAALSVKKLTVADISGHHGV